MLAQMNGYRLARIQTVKISSLLAQSELEMYESPQID